MANFAKCKQESVKFKQTKEATETIDVKVLWWTQSQTITKQVPAEDGIHENTPINLDLVKTFSRCSRILDRNSHCGTLEGGNKKFGIYFNVQGSSEYWYYDEEKLRDEQFEEISNNTHLYKSKVSI